MPLVKIRHALASWWDHETDTPKTAFRGQVVDMPEADITRLSPHGAIIPPDAELDRPGILLELPQSPTDEELVAWVIAASPSEIATLAKERPELTPRLLGAGQRVVDTRTAQSQHLAEISAAISNLKTDEAGVIVDEDIHMNLGATTPATGTDESMPPATLPDTSAPAGSGDFSSGFGGGDIAVPPDVNTVVLGSADEVANFLALHPELANEVLAAESAAHNGAPRAGVIAAAQAAVAHGG